MGYSQEKKKLLVLGVAALVVIALVSFFVMNGDRLTTTRTPQAQVEQIWSRGIDTSRSFFTPEETAMISGNVETRINKFLSGEDPSAQNLTDAARAVNSLRDFDQALALFAVVDTMNPQDKFYKVEVGNIYLERKQWEAARQVFEPMKVTWPVHEAYIGLATAYQNIEGTPEYVVDQIYEESMFRHRNEFAVLEEYVKWLNKTDREEKTIPLYEEMNRKAPQKVLEDKIAELKAKYNK
jgi:tetratricopeptide (TPR) repeat protein